MTDKPPTWEQYTSMQFKLEREIAGLKADCGKWKYHATQLQDQSTRIAWLENRVEELEKQINEIK